ncbi:hypothetical protein BW687_017795 [Pseudomonas graminis]|uniref:hypothetical protein n=1 Tax=Pseudomonas graminis TaxID=158627 RepID=UPI002349A31D|nr:hypothetical protein [Pseudomonas graminis]MDC6382024.1 hypothetical protein [Pseudomonas graminis]
MSIAITSIGTALGEHRMPYDAVQDFEIKRLSYGLPSAPNIMGWDHLHRSDYDALWLAERAISELTKNSADSIRPDHLLLCSSRFSNDFMHGNDLIGSMLDRLNMSNVPLTGLTLSGCNSLFNGLYAANAMLRSEMADRILVVTADVSPDESKRFDKNCMFSDAASAAVLTRADSSQLRIIELNCGFSRSQIAGSMFRGDLTAISEKVSKSLDMYELSVSDLTSIIVPNFYTPIVHMLLNSLKLPVQSRFTGNATLNAHCFASDYLIALEEIAKIPSASDEYHLLLGYSDLHHALALVHKKSDFGTLK